MIGKLSAEARAQLRADLDEFFRFCMTIGPMLHLRSYAAHCEYSNALEDYSFEVLGHRVSYGGFISSYPEKMIVRIVQDPEHPMRVAAAFVLLSELMGYGEYRGDTDENAWEAVRAPFNIKMSYALGLYQQFE